MAKSHIDFISRSLAGIFKGRVCGGGGGGGGEGVGSAIPVLLCMTNMLGDDLPLYIVSHAALM